MAGTTDSAPEREADPATRRERVDAYYAAYERGLDLEDAGDAPGAAAAYREALAIDPDDLGGASVRLAALGLAPSPERAPPGYVATLFDQCAEEFELTLVHALGYMVPDLAAARLRGLGLGPFARMADLGCGTGLVAEALGGRAAHATGVDLSPRMLDMAGEKGVFDALVRGDAVDWLAGVEPSSLDLIVAADVLPYLGETGPLLDAMARAASPGGVLVLSAETLPEEAFGDADYAVGPRNRFAHRAGPLRAGLAARGLEVLAFDFVALRFESGQPVPGHLIVARAAQGA